ncbi:Nitrogen regulation protein NR(I) [Aquisphaera giovannonii]|uniref:DNA-binding transcriptional regulator NtrC n=1 Tax=Aquisphaera giovannonii TaxID=406548 RepID=A0A5B9WDU4_9BACT|nr:sigma-54 dependent transcriptional regulator [Aquisphaera giovannonii]QEH38399.1 Nitrogen regulation protein NR(I) [Aquisphaera giovannonii]
MSRILIVDDEASICWSFRESFSDLGHEVEVASSAEEGLRIAASGPLDAVVLDVRLPGMDGLSALGPFRERIGPAPIIIITAFGDLDTAVRAMEGGAFDYLVKPFDLDQATALVTRALASSAAPQAVPGDDGPDSGPDALIGNSPAMQELFKQIALVAPTDVPVLITGESGTGKELIARAIHRHSRRRSGPFLPVCLAALNPNLVEGELFGHVRGSFTGATHDRRGLLELAGGGSVLLDEVGDIPLDLQVKLLRAVEHREATPVGDARPRRIDVRLVAATNRPLAELMKSGEFRQDLFFRLSVFQIEAPPLRARRDDIPLLAAHFLRSCRFAMTTSPEITPEALAELRRRPWEGNVRELRNAVEHAAVVSRGQPIRPEHLPPAGLGLAPSGPASGDGGGTSPPADDDARAIADRLSAWAAREVARPGAAPLHERFLDLAEPPLLRAVLDLYQGNRAAAAQVLGIHRATLRQKLRKYGIQ